MKKNKNLTNNTNIIYGGKKLWHIAGYADQVKLNHLIQSTLIMARY